MRENQCAATGCTKQAHYVEAQLCKRHYMQVSQRGKRIDGTPCLVCNETRGTQRCHITAARHGGTFTADNILPLCPTHHWCYDHDKLTEDELLAVIEAERKILGHSD